MAPQPIAFMSYSHLDDKHDNGYLSLLCERLSTELHVQTGEYFPIFRDRKDILWGQKWKERIEESLDAVTFFIPIITPKFFKSNYCRNELKQFLDRKNQLKRTDIILPIYYIDCSFLEAEDMQKRDELAEAIATHQYVDWRELRFSELTSSEVRQKIAELARQIRDALERTHNAELREREGEVFFIPRGVPKGDELEPSLGFLQMKSSDPRKLLEEALEKKQKGDYNAAQALHKKLLQQGVDWSKHISLFVDQLYFSISTHDKLEEWSELNKLEELFFIPELSRISRVITLEAYRTIRMMYQSSMALAKLRQIELEDALQRIKEALEESPSENEGAGTWILYANALTTCAIIRHAMWAYRKVNSSLLLKAKGDLEQAEPLYRKYAAMGHADEFHHLGRFFGTRAFLHIAFWKSKESMKLRVNELLLDSKRSHTGKNRTAYGKIAGYYCDAFCQFQVGLQEHNREKKREYFLNSLHLTQKASERVETYSCLALSKISGLAIRVARKLQALGMRIDNREFVDAHKKAKKSLKKRGYNFLDNIPCDRWLATPLN